jgi:transcriptional regulator with XRE-family HTH domain
MPVISKKFADELSNNKEMRDAYLEEKTRAKLAVQIKANRVAREWSQAELGQWTGKTQSNIHRLEDQNIARYTLTTLFQFASAYDCGLVVEFVPYHEFLQRTADLSPSHLQVPSFTPASLAPLWSDNVQLPNVDQHNAINAQPIYQHIENREKTLIMQSYSWLLLWTRNIENAAKSAMANLSRDIELSAQDALQVIQASQPLGTGPPPEFAISQQG